MILVTTTISYFSMASDLGSTPVRTEFRPPNVTRQVWVSATPFCLHAA